MVPQRLSHVAVLVALFLMVPRATPAAELKVDEDGACVVVREGGDAVVRYRWKDAAFKPYVQELRSPGGTNVLRDAPADHLHHHGLMFAVAVNGVNFWEETPGCGRQVHDSWLARTVEGPAGGQPVQAILAQKLRWQSPRGETVLEEVRRLVLEPGVGRDPRVMPWSSSLTAPKAGPGALLTGANYNGLGARFPAGMDKGGRFLDAAGHEGVADTLGRRSSWASYAAEAAPGRPVTLVLLDGRDNPRAPATWFTMERPFAYLAATLGLDKEPLRMRPGETLTLRYGVLVFDGKAAAADMAAAAARWAGP